MSTPETTEALSFSLDQDCLQDCSDSKGPQRFRAIAYTGAVVDRAYGKFAIDMAGIAMKDRVAMLVDHDGTKRVGFADKRLITDRGLEIEGAFLKSTPAGREVAESLREGFPFELSVGIHVDEREEVGEGQKIEVNGETLEGPISIARKSRLKEVSFLFSGADDSTYAVALAAHEKKEALVADEVQAPQAEDTREELKAFLGEFQGEEALAAVRFAEGKSITEVKLEIAERDTEALAALRVEHEALKEERDALLAKLDLLAQLDAEAGQPGVGFKGTPETDKVALAPTTYNEAWEASEALRAEFGNSKERFDRFCNREAPSLKELV